MFGICRYLKAPLWRRPVKYHSVTIPRGDPLLHSLISRESATVYFDHRQKLSSHELWLGDTNFTEILSLLLILGVWLNTSS